MKTKKFLGIIAIVVMLGFVFAGCGDGGGGDDLNGGGGGNVGGSDTGGTGGGSDTGGTGGGGDTGGTGGGGDTGGGGGTGGGDTGGTGAVTAISVTPTAAVTLTLGGTTTRQLQAATTPTGGTVTWHSSNTTVATVANGLVTARAQGTANITARSGSITSNTVRITVNPAAGGGGGGGGGTVARPGVPTNVRATALSATSVRVTWNAVTGATGYWIYVSSQSATANFSRWNAVTAHTGESFDVTGLQPNTRYWFRVRSNNSGGYSAQTTTNVNVTTPNVPPNPPHGLQMGARTSTSLTLQWNGVVRATSYRIYRSSMGANGPFAHVHTANQTGGGSHVFTNLVPNTEFHFRMTAVNASGQASAYSSVIAGRTLP